ALHTRNMYQVLGKSLNEPSRFLVCYAEPTLHGVKGGTNSAVVLAKRYNVKVYNLWLEADLQRIKQYVYPEEL
ncbi:MAG TPA: hypothetical protein VFM18_12470, partial [Methanosarcina sp.]|nr:hypothetical protein [Methanosarcina sp.]